MNKALHIIAFDVPYPPNYGGVIDVFYKIKSLYEEGVNITLHCFKYGRGEQNELKKYCKCVFYYKRKNGIFNFLSPFPYIVATRSSEELVNNLLSDNAPILFEGLHCCFAFKDERIKNREKIVRMHNIEHTYYANLAQVEKNVFKRMYFNIESGKLKHFESVLQGANSIAAISNADEQELSQRYKNVVHISAFHPHDKVCIKQGKGKFVLYHGNLKVGENNQAALYLVNEIMHDDSIPFIIAGNKASEELKKAIRSKQHIQLKENVSIEELYSMVQDAQINILPTFQETGIKLKLLTSLYTGRHCLVNSSMVKNTGLESLCVIANSPQQMQKEVARLMQVEFSPEKIIEREEILNRDFSNKTNIKKILELL